MGLTSEEAEAMRKQIGDLSTDIARATQANTMLSENLRQSTIDLTAERGKVVDLSTDLSRAQTESQNLQ